MDLMNDTKTFEWSIVGIDNNKVSIALLECVGLVNLMEHIT